MRKCLGVKMNPLLLHFFTKWYFKSILWARGMLAELSAQVEATVLLHHSLVGSLSENLSYAMSVRVNLISDVASESAM